MVHFFHKAHSPDQETNVRQEIATEQLTGWYFFYRLLKARWEGVFGNWSDEFDEYDKQLRKLKQYLSVIFEQLGPGIRKRKKTAGSVFMDCPSCGFSAGTFGSADVLAWAKGTSVDGVRDAGAVESGGGKVRLPAVGDYSVERDPTTDDRVPVWQACHQMARALTESESAAGALLARMPEKTEPIRQLAYRLYTVCERKGWAEEARIYNGPIASWHAIVDASHQPGHKGEQIGLEI